MNYEWNGCVQGVMYVYIVRILEINVAGASTGLNRDTVDLSLVSRGYFHSLVASSCCLVDDN